MRSCSSASSVVVDKGSPKAEVSRITVLPSILSTAQD
jgi:hypothetical protein